MYRPFAALLAAALVMVSALPAAAMDLLKVSETIFDRPHDVLPSDNGLYLFVADLGNNRIAVLDAESLKLLGTIGEGELSQPHDLAFDPFGNLLVADTGNGAIVSYAINGISGQKTDTWIRGLTGPEGVAVGDLGQVYIADTSGDAIVVYQDGRFVKTVGSSGPGPLQFRRPHDLIIDHKGNVVVADSSNDRLQVLDPDLNFVEELGGAAYGFKEPKYLHDEPGWGLLVADEYNNVIKVLGPGGIIATIGDGMTAPPGGLNRPEGVAVREDRVWIADTYNGRILLYRRGP